MVRRGKRVDAEMSLCAARVIMPVILKPLLLFTLGFRLLAQGGWPDPAFDAVPFNEWVAGGEQAQIRWTVRVSMIGLSTQQRLRARIAVQVDGNEVAKRLGKGQLVILTRAADREGRVYQIHQPLQFKDVTEATSKVDIAYSHDAFVLPGDYPFSVVIFDTATREHSVAKRMLHVPALKNDPLPAAWRDLPPIEFLTSAEPPDSWFQPGMKGRLNLPLETRHPVRIEVLVNASPTEFTSRLGRASNMNLGVLIPALKVLSQVQVRDGSMEAVLLDLTRQRVNFEQTIARGLDWNSVKEALAEANPNIIDVHSLENREQKAQFFVDEVKRRIVPASGEPLRILIVLSGPMAFRSGEDLRPIDLDKSDRYRIFYVRYHSFQARGIPGGFDMSVPTRGGPRSLPMPPQRAVRSQMDSLERTLKPLEPRLFDVDSPDQFRKALAAMLSEISRM